MIGKTKKCRHCGRFTPDDERHKILVCRGRTITEKYYVCENCLAALYYGRDQKVRGRWWQFERSLFDSDEEYVKFGTSPAVTHFIQLAFFYVPRKLWKKICT